MATPRWRSARGLFLSQDLPDHVRKLRGPKGTTVTVRLRRVGFPELITMTITRAEIPTKSVRYAFMLEPGVAGAPAATYQG